MANMVEEFWARVSPEPNTGCWLWAGYVRKDGYGLLSNRSGRPRHVRAHRFAYELLREPIQAELELDHLCRQRSCVNPAHLEAVTRRTNQLRGESPSAACAKRTHCVHGHQFDAANTYVWLGGRHPKRMCRRCNTERQRRYNGSPT